MSKSMKKIRENCMNADLDLANIQEQFISYGKHLDELMKDLKEILTNPNISQQKKNLAREVVITRLYNITKNSLDMSYKAQNTHRKEIQQILDIVDSLEGKG